MVQSLCHDEADHGSDAIDLYTITLQAPRPLETCVGTVFLYQTN